MTDRKLRWGILGPGGIAQLMANDMNAFGFNLYAVGSRSQARADEFAAKFGVAKAYGSYEALVADPDVQAIYISTPHPMHAEWAVRAADAGKHILCEKPMAMNRFETSVS